MVTARGEAVGDVAVQDGRIQAVGPNLPDSAPEEVDASGLHVFPGGIDSHVHLNEPGRTEWEDVAHGSAALAAGGYTAFIDMPLNNLPVTTTVEAFDLKLEAVQRSSRIDFGLWAGLVPGSMNRLEGLVQRGAMGFKAFMCPSGIDEFPACDGRSLRAGMRRIAALGSILLVHAEDQHTIDVASRRVKARGAREFVRSRPPAAEVEAIERLVRFYAPETRCALHIVHVSTPRGVEVILEAQRHGQDISGETCPHYLIYTSGDLERLGGLGKCAPPLRNASDRQGLWAMLRSGKLTMVVSDHSPSTLALKEGDDFFRVWGGISGCQHTRQLLLAQGRLSLPAIAAVTSTNVARRFRLEGKGDIAPGFDADLWIADLRQEAVVRREDLLYKNRFSAHEGQRIRGLTVRTIVRGRTVHPGGKATGRFMRPGLRADAGAGSRE